MPTLKRTMALRLHLSSQAVHTLSQCSAAVRERLQCELGALTMVQPGERRAPAGTLVLHSGFHVRYQLDAHRGLLHLLDVWAPEDAPGARPV
jgi:hypothetical protein